MNTKYSRCQQPVLKIDREQRVNKLMIIEVVTQELNNWEHGNLELIKCVVVHLDMFYTVIVFMKST